MKKHVNEIKTTYAVKLGVNVGSFYDPYSGCNLFLKTPYYFFNHKPTKAIITGLKSGKLIDVKGNISLNEQGVKVEASNVDIEALKTQIRKEIESEVRAELAAQADVDSKAEATSKAKVKKAKEDSKEE